MGISPSVGEFVGQAQRTYATWLVRRIKLTTVTVLSVRCIMMPLRREEGGGGGSRSCTHHGCLFPLEKSECIRTAVSITDETCGGHIRKFNFVRGSQEIDLQELKIPRNINLKIV
jgi:hypothetical protein